MAETKQISFDLVEVATTLIKKEGIHTGRWMLGFEFTFGAGNFATAGSPDTKPGSFTQINKVVLTRQDEGTPNLPFVVDAAVVNPAKTAPDKKPN